MNIYTCNMNKFNISKFKLCLNWQVKFKTFKLARFLGKIITTPRVKS